MTTKPGGYWDLPIGSRYIVYRGVALPIEVLVGDIDTAGQFHWHAGIHRIEVVEDDLKTCRDCEQVAPRSTYYIDRSHHDRRSPRCRECRTAWEMARRQGHL